MSLTTTEFNEDFKRCDKCKCPEFFKKEVHIVRKGSHRTMESEELLICSECGKEYESNNQ